ncbi:hypothetical protein [Flavobacterium caeni]|uniref:hypothetical protein n=1 Tax=Flavobacterium caeni TaxID=490189 RepID=UPI000B862105|nr:hypothetical protein [Flavobacterium caeni]
MYIKGEQLASSRDAINPLLALEEDLSFFDKFRNSALCESSVVLLLIFAMLMETVDSEDYKTRLMSSPNIPNNQKKPHPAAI